MVTTRFGCITEPPARSWRRRLARVLPGFGVAAVVAVLMVAAFEYGRSAQAQDASDRYRVEHWRLLEDMRSQDGEVARYAILRASTRTIALVRELAAAKAVSDDGETRAQAAEQLDHLEREIERAAHGR